MALHIPAGTASKIRLPYFLSPVPAGYPSPADNYIEENFDLNEYLIGQPEETFLVKASGKSMVNAGIMDQALLVVNRAREPAHDDVVIAAIDGEITCKILDKRSSCLRAANLDYDPIQINENSECVVLGVVTYAINPLCSQSVT